MTSVYSDPNIHIAVSSKCHLFCYRLALAALHFNENTRRMQAVTKTGNLRYAMSFPKAKKGEGIAREVKIDQTFGKECLC